MDCSGLVFKEELVDLLMGGMQRMKEKEPKITPKFMALSTHTVS